MNRKFTFTLTTEDYLNYLRFQSLRSKQGKGMRLWMRICIPALLLCILISFRLYVQPIWSILALVLSVAWLFYACPIIWKKYVYKRINEDTLKQLNITGFEKIEVTFKDDKIIYKDKKINEILYKDIRSMLPIEKVFIFLYQQQGVMLLPYRLFVDEDDMTEFFREFEVCWKEYQK